MARIQFLFPASVMLTLAVAVPTFAQGKSQGHKKSAPPSQSKLPPPGAGTGGATPLAWIDDASLVEPGAVLLAVSMTRWLSKA